MKMFCSALKSRLNEINYRNLYLCGINRNVFEERVRERVRGTGRSRLLSETTIISENFIPAAATSTIYINAFMC